MRIDRYISNSRIIDLSSRDLRSAYSELLDTFGTQLTTPASRKKVLKELVEREKSLTSYIGEGVALPHARVPMKRPYALAVGRCPAGLTFEGRDSYEDIRFVFLLLANEKAKNYLSFLAALARAFQDNSVMDQLWMARDKNEFKNAVRNAFAETDDRPARRRTKFNKLLTDEAAKIAKAAECSTILVFTDVFPPTLAPRMTFPNFKVVLAGEGVTEEDQAHHRADATLAVRALSRSRLSQLRAAILLGLTREIFGFQDRVCCVGGIPDSGQLDTVLVVDVDEEFESVIGQGDEMLPTDVAAESLERLTAIATDLATAGREGKSIGAMFVLGDHEEVIKRSKQLILNPFHGYAEEDRNILNPFMDETIKELALIDGAFIVQGNGVVESAGCLIQAKADEIDLPGGMGTRHAAAAAITQTTESLALVVSSSGQVTYFRKGRMFTLFDKSEGRSL
jgi:DNA integrity scanning protein DisA with diadenylate cyclase activity/mannitol/fructose-specific phosphotransferase system IIA component (Ntr-type)